MMNVKNSLERIFGAVSFAEANCRQHAIDHLGAHTAPAGEASILQWIRLTWKPRVENLFNAVAFAECNCPEHAEEFIAEGTRRCRTETLQDFLDTIGLGNVPVYYGVAHL
jgi:hypothetical protein